MKIEKKHDLQRQSVRHVMKILVDLAFLCVLYLAGYGQETCQTRQVGRGEWGWRTGGPGMSLHMIKPLEHHIMALQMLSCGSPSAWVIVYLKASCLPWTRGAPQLGIDRFLRIIVRRLLEWRKSLHDQDPILPRSGAPSNRLIWSLSLGNR